MEDDMAFFESNSIWVYFIIFFGKIIEVTVATIRLVLINRGERTIGSFIAFFEIILWIVITGTVLAGFQSNPIKIVVFGAAFAIGNYLGSWLENKIAVGISTIQVITSGDGDELVRQIRDSNVAVTVMDGQGKDGPRKILLIHIKRSRIPVTVKLINKICPDCMISVSDLKTIKGGYIKK